MRLGNIKHFSNCVLGIPHFCQQLNRIYVLLCEFISVLTEVVPSFDMCVSNIVKVGSQPKVIGIDTKSVVSIGAIMADEHAFWNRATIQNPRRSVRSYLSGWSWACSHCSISGTFWFSNPQPARISFINSGPKPIWKRFGKSLREKVRFGNFWLHDKFVLLCRALGCFSSAEVFLLFPMKGLGSR